MRRTLLLAVAAGLLGFAGAALAQSTIVRWDAIVGVRGYGIEDPTHPQMTVAGIRASLLHMVGGRLGHAQPEDRTCGDRRSQHLPGGGHRPGAARCACWARRERKGIFVCDARGINGQTAVVATGGFLLDATGSINYRGTVTVPQACRDYPEETVFLMGAVPPESPPDFVPINYFAFGAARKLLNHE